MGGRLAIVMEWVPGGSLAERVREGPLPIPQAVEVARQALEVLAHVPARQVVHRDVKPSNLLWGADGQVKLADLGLARSLAEGCGVTRTHVSVGTPAYTSPEQLLGLELRPAWNLYGLGATLYELLTGRLPFDAAAGGGTEARLTSRPTSPRQARRECPAWLARFVLRLLEREPRDRFRDAGCALAALERRRVLLSPRLWRRLSVGAVAAALAVALGLGLWQHAAAKLASVSVAGSEVVALDRRGRELWRREFPGFEPLPLRADLLGDAAPEVIVALRRSSKGMPEGPHDLVILTGDGTRAGSVASTMSRLRLDFPKLVAATFGPVVYPMDLEGDNATDLVWKSPHLRWYPTVVGGWNMRQQDASRPLFVNSGSVHELATADLDRDGQPELLAVGINNPLGYRLALAIIRPAPMLREPITDPFHSPDRTFAWQGRQAADTLVAPSDVPLGPFAAKARIVSASHEGITLVAGEKVLKLDADGNPAGSALAGRGWRWRARFWLDFGTACRALEDDGGRLKDLRRGIEDTHAAALAEPPMRMAATLMLARALARGGGHEEAIALLAEAEGSIPNDLDLPLRLGEQLAISGRTREAEAAFLRARQFETVGRGPLDAVVALSLLAAWQGGSVEGVAAFWESLMASGSPSSHGRELRALGAFAAGDWSSPLLGDPGDLPSLPMAPFLHQWAVHERGGDGDGVRTAAERLIAEREFAAQARVLLARLALRGGQAPRAVSMARASLAELERRGRESWEVYAWVALAERVLAEALIAAGRGDEAAPHMARARRLAPGAWFGAGAAGEMTRRRS